MCEVIFMDEQWKSGGDCDICRRKNYCKNACKANKERTSSLVANAVLESIFSAVTSMSNKNDVDMNE